MIKVTDFSTDMKDLTSRALARLSRLSVFSEAEYLRLNPDIAQAGLDGPQHALEHGAREGRELFSESAMARAYGRAARGLDGPTRPVATEKTDSLHRTRPVTIFVHSLSDLPARDAASTLVRDLRQARIPVTLLDETADHLADHGIKIFVAPHDFFTIGVGALWLDPEILRDSYILNTVSGETIEGRRALPAILYSRGVLEASAIWAAIWRNANIDTLDFSSPIVMRSQWLCDEDQLHPLILGAPQPARATPLSPWEWKERPLDLLHFDPESERRNVFFGRHAASFAQYSTYLYLQQGANDLVEERLYRRTHHRIFSHLATQARLTLSLANRRYPTLDRYRVVNQSMAGGTVVVSDVTFVDPLLRAGTHYFHADTKHIAGLIDWLLEDPDGHRAAERTRQTCFDLIASINGDTGRPLRIAAFLTETAAIGRQA